MELHPYYGVDNRDKEKLRCCVQHPKACIGRDDVVLKSKQVEVLEVLYEDKDCVVDRLWQEPLLPPASSVFVMTIYKRGKMNAAEAEWIVVSDQVSSLQSRGVSADS